MKRLLIVLMAVMLFIGATVASANNGRPLALTGEAEGFGGLIKVTVTLEGDKITEVVAIGDEETVGIGTPALTEVPARIVATNSADVDVLTGATYTSEGVINAVKKALKDNNEVEEPIKQTDESSQLPTEAPARTFEYDFKTFRWGATKEDVRTVEGIPDYEGKMDAVNATYIGYVTKAVGLDVILAYYFCDEGLYSTRYILQEKHSNESLYIDDYSTFRDALTKKYGKPIIDNEKWQDDSKKDYYKNKKGDALSYGYLTYSTWYFSDTSIITMGMSADNYDITMQVDYESLVISPGEADHSNDI